VVSQVSSRTTGGSVIGVKYIDVISVASGVFEARGSWVGIPVEDEVLTVTVCTQPPVNICDLSIVFKFYCEKGNPT